MAIASEGSFYPHPAFPFISCDREIILLLDRDNDLEIIGQEISTETNHNHTQVSTIEEALEFAASIGFPEHGLKDCLMVGMAIAMENMLSLMLPIQPS